MSHFEMIDVAVETRGVAWLTLNRPEAKNAMSQQLMRELRTAARQLDEDRSVRVIVLTGAGEVFSAGGDLKGMTQQADNTREGPHRRCHRVCDDPLGPQRSGQAADRADQRFGVWRRLGADIDLRHRHWPRRGNFPLERSHARPDPGDDFALRAWRRSACRTRGESCSTPASSTGPKRRGWDFSTTSSPTIEELDEAVEREVAAALSCAPGAVANAKELIRFVSTHNAQENLAYTANALADSWETAELREGIDAFFHKRKPNWQA